MKLNKTLLSLSLSYMLVAAPSYADTSVGAYVNHDGWSVDTIDQFNVATARNASTINVFSGFSTGWELLAEQSSNVSNSQLEKYE